MKDKLKKIGLALASTLLALAVCEFLLAVPIYYFVKGTGETFYTRAHRPSLMDKTNVKMIEDPVLGYTNTPNLKRKAPLPPGRPTAPRFKIWYDVETDENGFRYNGDLSTPKPPGEIRIFSLGGSTTFGPASPNSLTYPQQLEDLLGDHEVRVINAGVDGYRSIHLLKYYQERIRKLQPDIITIYCGWNDYGHSLLPFWEPKNPLQHYFSSQMKLAKVPFMDFALVWFSAKLYYRMSDSGFRTKLLGSDPQAEQYFKESENKRWIDEHKDNLNELILASKSDGVVPVLINFPSPFFENASLDAKKYADQDIDMAGLWDAYVIAMGHARSNLRELAKSNNIPLIDVNIAFEKLNDDYKAKFKIFTDKMHLVPAGNTLIAETMLDPIKKIVQKRRALEGVP